jgi:hypothetical protein
MGADLYRKTTTVPDRLAAVAAYAHRFGDEYHHPEWGELHNADGWYFRDSYNESSLFWKLDLSWWQDLDQYMGPQGDGVLATDDNGEEGYSLHPAGMRRLAAEVRSRSELLMYNCRDLPDDSGPNGVLDKRHFAEKYDRFLRFLSDAADAGDTIYCSV